MVVGREGNRETDLLETRAGSVGLGLPGGFLVVHEMSAALLWRHEDLRKGWFGESWISLSFGFRSILSLAVYAQ